MVLAETIHMSIHWSSAIVLWGAQPWRRCFGRWLVGFFFPGPQDIGKVRVPPAVRAIARKPEEGLKRPHINRIDASRRRGYNKLLRT
jgi:hypothetical protein